MVGAAPGLGDLDRALQRRDGLLEPAQAAVDRRQHVEAHGQVEAGLAVRGAPLERLGRPDRVVEGLGGAVAGGDGVPRELEEEGPEIRVVERRIGRDAGAGAGGGPGRLRRGLPGRELGAGRGGGGGLLGERGGGLGRGRGLGLDRVRVRGRVGSRGGVGEGDARGRRVGRGFDGDEARHGGGGGGGGERDCWVLVSWDLR